MDIYISFVLIKDAKHFFSSCSNEINMDIDIHGRACTLSRLIRKSKIYVWGKIKNLLSIKRCKIRSQLFSKGAD